jgi:hypothetical protein
VVTTALSCARHCGLATVAQRVLEKGGPESVRWFYKPALEVELWLHELRCHEMYRNSSCFPNAAMVIMNRKESRPW